MKGIRRITCISIALLFLLTGSLHSRDTLKLDFQQAEALFLENNLHLLAQRYQIDMAEAMIIQARLWPNPEFSVEEVTLFPQRRILEELPGGNWNITAELEQLIETAGKRKKRTEVAKMEWRLEQAGFEEMLHALRFVFREQYIHINYLERAAELFTEELETLDVLIQRIEMAVQERLATRLELARLKTLQQNLRSERLEILQELSELRADFRTLLNLPPTDIVALEPVAMRWQNTPVAAQQQMLRVLDLAAQNRPDLRSSRIGLEHAHSVLAYERAQAVPDVAVSIGYDRAGAFAQNYIGFGASIDLPLFNRNQGNIQASGIGVSLAESLIRSQEIEIFNEVAAALIAWQNVEQAIAEFDTELLDLYSSIMDDTRFQYINRNISMLEFLDFIESFREMQVYWLELNKTYDLAALHFFKTLGTDNLNDE